QIRKLLKGLLLTGFSLGVFAPETLNPASCIHQLLLAGEERMAAGANFNMNIALVRGARSKAVSASAHYAHFVISGMDSCFHFSDDLDSEELDSTGLSLDSATVGPSLRGRAEILLEGNFKIHKLIVFGIAHPGEIEMRSGERG